MASGVYNRGKLLFADGTHVWGTTNMGVALVTSSYTPNADHNFVSDLTNELSGGNYARVTNLTTRTLTEDDTNDRVDVDASKATFSSLGAVAGTPQYAIIYQDTGGVDTARQLLFWIDLGTPTVPDGNNYEIRWNSVDGTGTVARFS